MSSTRARGTPVALATSSGWCPRRSIDAATPTLVLGWSSWSGRPAGDGDGGWLATMGRLQVGRRDVLGGHCPGAVAAYHRGPRQGPQLVATTDRLAVSGRPARMQMRTKTMSTATTR